MVLAWENCSADNGHPSCLNVCEVCEVATSTELIGSRVCS